jgi:hypothetical protein
MSVAFPRKGRSAGASTPGVVAIVNGQPISNVDYDLALRRIVDPQGQPVTDRDRQTAVDRAIDDELMIEYGLSLGMARHDPATRQALLSAVFTVERSRGSTRTPSDDELKRYYAQIRSLLQPTGKMRLRQIVARSRLASEREEARARAEDAVRRLRSGEPFEHVRAAVETLGEKALPDIPLSVEDLTKLVGPITVKRALELRPGQVSDVVGNDQVFRILQLVEQLPPEIPAFEEARDLVLLRYKDRAADDAFAAKLAELRGAAQIRVAPVHP